ncbi:MAG TPA: hypothetical protein VEA81_14285, partial [Burkholderiaceae bacterium]|nr:hypothetical protein [Burkholderiaceae bacterium]
MTDTPSQRDRIALRLARHAVRKNKTILADGIQQPTRTDDFMTKRTWLHGLALAAAIAAPTLAPSTASAGPTLDAIKQR